MRPSPLLSLIGMPITALALISAMVVKGSLSSAEVRPLGSARRCAVKVRLVASSSASMSICTPDCSACIGVTPAATMPAGRRTASVQKPSLPNVSKRNTSRPRPASPSWRGKSGPWMSGPSAEAMVAESGVIGLFAQPASTANAADSAIALSAVLRRRKWADMSIPRLIGAWLAALRNRRQARFGEVDVTAG